MKKLLVLIAVFFSLEVNAQNYLISFAGTGASGSVSSVKVENLTAGTSTTLTGVDILNLTFATSISSIDNKRPSELKIYPNPMTDNSLIQIYPPAAGDATITIFDMNGKQVAQIQSYMDNYQQEFQISGIKTGAYLISVKGNTWQYAGKLLSKGISNGTISIKKVSYNIQVDHAKISKTDHKGTQTTVDMAFTIGDRLKFTGTSGNYSTVVTDIPTSDKLITFNFIACTDADNNNYPVVEIGTQIWMAENLKTTKYQNSNPIGNVTDDESWGALTSGAYCWYNNDKVTYNPSYGPLYNYYAVYDSRKIAPVGWHVPTKAEWTTLVNYLGGEGIAGGKLKECGSSHWPDPNTNATNETGFTAIPGGYRWYYGIFNDIGAYGYWWSSSWSGLSQATYRTIRGTSIQQGYSDKYYGYSVRCVKD
jgi:uncharacterized protein (TIGR02145 family)